MAILWWLDDESKDEIKLLIKNIEIWWKHMSLNDTISSQNYQNENQLVILSSILSSSQVIVPNEIFLSVTLLEDFW